MRSIDADVLKKKISDVYENKNIYQMIDEIPTVDAVPVVRCKDCKHGQPMIYRHTERPCIMCSHLGSGFFARVFNPNWFCADGERWDSENG